MDASGAITEMLFADGKTRQAIIRYSETWQMYATTLWAKDRAGATYGERTHISYDYDAYGNLVTRSKGFAVGIGGQVTEHLAYDRLQRLISETYSNAFIPGRTYRYDGVGNLLAKSDYADTYRYGENGAGPNQVSSIHKLDGQWISLAYDANGNQTVGDGRTVSYNVFNKLETVIKSGISLDFDYGPDTARYRQVKTGSGKTVTTLYVGKLFEHITTTAMGQPTRVEQKAYLGDAAVLTEIRTGGGLPTYKVGFLHKDRLGSLIAITDEDGKETEWHAFDAFGLPLKGDFTSSGGLLNTASTVEAYSATDNPGATTRGFTGHEHLDDVQLIHMNGRAYDPSLGRFLSVDTFIQGNGNSQGLNPYSYILNNPLAGTDPTGYLACDPGAHQCGGLPWTETGMGRGITRNGYICSGMGRPCVPTFSSGDEGNGSESGTQPGNTSGTTGDQVEQIAELNSPTRTEAMVDYGDLGVSLQRGEHTPGRYVLTARAPVKEAELKGELKSLGLDLLPVIGSFKAVVQLVTGRDAVTGERVSRAGELFGILLGLVPGGRTAQKAPKIIRVGERLAARHSNVLSPSAIVREVEREVTKEGTTVIGRVKDLQKLNKGEKSLLDRLPDQGSPKANWKQNSGVLRQEMNQGKPIRDASPGDTAGQFLNAERNLLRDRGWTFDPKTNYWNPPKQLGR